MKTFRHLSAIMAIALAAMPVMSAFAADITPKVDEKKGTWGFVKSDGKWAVKPKFDSASVFTERPDGKSTSEVKQKGLIGYVDENGKLLGQGTVFESVEPLDGDAMLVKVKGKYGVATYSCVYIVKPELVSVERIDDNRLLVDLKGKKGILDNKGTYLVAPVYDNIDLSLDGYLRVMKGGKCGLLDDGGRVLLQPTEFTSIEPFGRYWKVGKGNKKGIYDLAGNNLIAKADYDDVADPVVVEGETYTPILKGKKWGAVDTRGKEVLKCRNSKVMAVSDMGLFLVERPGFGYRLWFPREKVFLEMQLTSDRSNGPFKIITGDIDRPTESYPDRIAPSVRFDEIGQWSGTYQMRQQVYRTKFPNGRFSAMLDRNGNLVSSNSNTTVKSVGNYYEVSVGNSADIYDAEGNRVLRDVEKGCTSKNGWLFSGNTSLSPDKKKYLTKQASDEIFMKDEDGTWRYFDGMRLADNGYQQVEPTDGITHVCRDGKWGLFKQGRETIACQHPSKLEYSSSLNGILVREGNLVGLSQTDGTPVISPKYNSIEALGDWIKVGLGDKVGILTGKGKEIIPPVYDNVYGLDDLNHWVIEKDGLQGMIDDNGKTVLEPVYEIGKKTEVNNHRWLKKGNLWGVCDENGATIVPVKYTDSALQTIEKRYYCAIVAGKETYYNASGNILTKERRINVTSQYIEHNHYDKNNNKGLKYNFNIEAQFLLEEPFYAEVKFYHANGTPAKNRKGQHIKWGYWLTPSYLFSIWSNQWITMPYNQFSGLGSRGTKKDFYAVITFKDAGGKAIKTTGNNKIPFYLTF